MIISVISTFLVILMTSLILGCGKPIKEFRGPANGNDDGPIVSPIITDDIIVEIDKQNANTSSKIITITEITEGKRGFFQFPDQIEILSGDTKGLNFSIYYQYETNDDFALECRYKEIKQKLLFQTCFDIYGDEISSFTEIPQQVGTKIKLELTDDDQEAVLTKTTLSYK